MATNNVFYVFSLSSVGEPPVSARCDDHGEEAKGGALFALVVLGQSLLDPEPAYTSWDHAWQSTSVL